MASATATSPIHSLALFAGLLRDQGMKIGVAEQKAMLSVMTSLATEGRTDRSSMSAAWRAIACNNAREWRQWPELFDRFWFPHRVKGTVRVSGKTRSSRNLREAVAAMHQQMDEAASLPKTSSQQQQQDLAATSHHEAPESSVVSEAAQQARGGASRSEALLDRSISEWSPDDLLSLQKLADQIAAQLRRRLTRRWQSNPQGRKLDIRRSLRESLATGGVPVNPAWRRERRVQPRLFILVDVSRSMESYSQLFLRIARAFVQAAQARVFVFHTRLAEVTPLLERDSASVQEKVNAVTAGFGGGTRIATSIHDFLQVHAKRQLNRGARVWILSDGFDADPEWDLAARLDQVKQRGAQITWFHPTVAAPASQAMLRVAEQGSVQRFIPLATLRHLIAARSVLF